jgi:glycolate oxidase FAD binding subunit
MSSTTLPVSRLSLESIRETLRAIVGPDRVNFDHDSGSATIAEPESESEIAEVLRFANNAGLAVIPRGGGTKLDWGNPPRRTDIVLSTARLNQVIEHAWADLTVEVQSGCTIAHLAEVIARNGQTLPVDALWPKKATIGGILSVNDSGVMRLRFGGLRDLIIGVTVVLADGTQASAGGKVVKNVAGYDLSKLLTGALGTLGVITRAIFRLYPMARETRTICFRIESVKAAHQLLHAIQNSSLAHSALQVLLSSGVQPEMHILFEGTEEGIAAQTARIRELATGFPEFQPQFSPWRARQTLWRESGDEFLTKLTILPSCLQTTVSWIERLAERHRAKWNAVIQATGIGCLRIEAEMDEGIKLLTELREAVERDGGSLAILRQPAGCLLEVWGSPGDAIAMMRALKQQFDPRGTLNPGRFVGGI